MELRVTSLDTTRTGYRVDVAGSDKPTKPRGAVVAGTPSAALAGLVRQQDRIGGGPRGAMQLYNVRGVSPVSPGDDSEFGKALEAAADKKIDTLLAGVDKGLSPAEAAEQANKALGKTDPQSNFSALDPVALRGRDEPPRPDANIPAVQYGDRDTFGNAINVTADKQAEVYGQAAQGGASSSDAQDAANQAVGKSDPQANFSAGARHARDRTSTNNVALRGMEETYPGDGSIFDKVIDQVEDRLDTVFGQSLESGSSPEEAREAADKATGKIDPQANFSVRRPVLSSLAAALRLGRPHSKRLPEAEQRPRPILRPRMA